VVISSWDELYEIIKENDWDTRGMLASAIWKGINPPEGVDNVLSSVYAGHMTTTSTASVTTIVNPNPASVALGVTVQSLILAMIVDRPHLRDGITDINYNVERGVGVLVKDAGIRQHLANTVKVGEPKDVTEYKVAGLGTGYAREGELLGVKVTIWNLEA
jgi:hypothetical protein